MLHCWSKSAAPLRAIGVHKDCILCTVALSHHETDVQPLSVRVTRLLVCFFDSREVRTETSRITSPKGVPKSAWAKAEEYREERVNAHSDNGISIKLLDSTKDLGITIDGSFKPSMHCAQANKRALAALFLIRRSFVPSHEKSSFLCTQHKFALILSTPFKLRVLTSRKISINGSVFND